MSNEVVRGGNLSVEFDRQAGVVLLVCERHRVQDAISNERETLGVLMVDFFSRHERCRADPESTTIDLPSR